MSPFGHSLASRLAEQMRFGPPCALRARQPLRTRRQHSVGVTGRQRVQYRSDDGWLFPELIRRKAPVSGERRIYLLDSYFMIARRRGIFSALLLAP